MDVGCTLDLGYIRIISTALNMLENIHELQEASEIILK